MAAVTSGAQGTSGVVATTRVPWPAKFAALSFIWGSSFLLMKVGLRALAPLQVSTLRILVGALVLLVLLAATPGRLPRTVPVWRHLVVAGFFLGPVPFTLFAAAEERVSSALAGIGNAITPLATMLFGLALLPTVRLEPRKVVAIVVGFVGVLVIMQPWESAGRPDLWGFGLTLLAGVSYGVGFTWNRRFLAGVDAGGVAMPAAQLLAGSLLMLPTFVGWWLLHREEFPQPWSARPDAVAGQGWWALLAVLALGALGTGVAYMLQFDVLRAAGPTVAATVTYVIPVVSVLLGVLVLDERLAWPQAVGAAVVVSAAVVVGGGRLGRRHT